MQQLQASADAERQRQQQQQQQQLLLDDLRNVLEAMEMRRGARALRPRATAEVLELAIEMYRQCVAELTGLVRLAEHLSLQRQHRQQLLDMRRRHRMNISAMQIAAYSSLFFASDIDQMILSPELRVLDLNHVALTSSVVWRGQTREQILSQHVSVADVAESNVASRMHLAYLLSEAARGGLIETYSLFFPRGADAASNCGILRKHSVWASFKRGPNGGQIPSYFHVVSSFLEWSSRSRLCFPDYVRLTLAQGISAGHVHV